ncbi:MAG: amidohydrolase [Candidatus Eiseniibacteriota bacterium]
MSGSAWAIVRGALLPSRPDGADSLLVDGETIARIGQAEDILALLPPGGRVFDAAGRAVSAGFHDAHFHFLQMGIKASHPTLVRCRSRAELFDAVDQGLTLHPGRRLLVFEEWDETNWSDSTLPTRAELDRVAPDRAVVLRRIDDHTAVANTRGLERLRAVWQGTGIDEESGLCREGVVQQLEELFPPDEDELGEAFAAAARLCFSLGITTACDFLRPGACDAYAERFDAVHPTPRIDAFIWAKCLADPRLAALPLSSRLRLRGIKAWADGSVGAREAALFEDYADRQGARGTLLYTDAELEAIVRAGHGAGLTVAVHAIGDRAIAQVLDAFAKLPRAEIAAQRHRIEHLELPRDKDIARLVELGVRPCVQPNFVGLWAGPGGLYERALGAERLRRMNPFGTLLRRGTGVFFGSDGMPPSPLFGIRSAMKHPVPDERLTFAEAHRLYTVEAARAVAGDSAGATLEPGAHADIVVLPASPGALPGSDEDEMALTVAGGRVVHRGAVLEALPRRC